MLFTNRVETFPHIMSFTFKEKYSEQIATKCRILMSKINTELCNVTNNIRTTIQAVLHEWHRPLTYCVKQRNSISQYLHNHRTTVPWNAPYIMSVCVINCCAANMHCRYQCGVMNACYRHSRRQRQVTVVLSSRWFQPWSWTARCSPPRPAHCDEMKVVNKSMFRIHNMTTYMVH